jgi:hypothetical protein
VRKGRSARVSWAVTSASGAELALANPLNRVRARVTDPRIATIQADAPDAAIVVGRHVGRTTLRLRYQRRSAAGSYYGVFNLFPAAQRPVTARVEVRVRP